MGLSRTQTPLCDETNEDLFVASSFQPRDRLFYPLHVTIQGDGAVISLQVCQSEHRSKKSSVAFSFAINGYAIY
jgi:hypothetical protein